MMPFENDIPENPLTELVAELERAELDLIERLLSSNATTLSVALSDNPSSGLCQHCVQWHAFASIWVLQALRLGFSGPATGVIWALRAAHIGPGGLKSPKRSRKRFKSTIFQLFRVNDSFKLRFDCLDPQG